MLCNDECILFYRLCSTANQSVGKRYTPFLVDEAHNFGSYSLSQKLNPNIEYRLALSATLERHGDPVGTRLLKEYFGAKCIEYGLERAIREGKLTPYYYPVLVYLEDDEAENIKTCHIR